MEVLLNVYRGVFKCFCGLCLIRFCNKQGKQYFVHFHKAYHETHLNLSWNDEIKVWLIHTNALNCGNS